jgi:hypothetical protein
MNQSSKELRQTEQVTNNEQKADNQQVSPSIRQCSVGRSISVYSNAPDNRLNYREEYVFHHFVTKRHALIECIKTGQLMEVHFENFRFK